MTETPCYRIPVAGRSELAKTLGHFEALYGITAIYLCGTFTLTDNNGSAFISDRDYPVIGRRGSYFTVLVGEDEVSVRVNETAEGHLILKAHNYAS